MSYINFNPNPERKLVGDCVIRAISKVMNQSWDATTEKQRRALQQCIDKLEQQ